ncbi:MAG TPA: DUF6600 domain-containing protein [Balneolales bacterium]|nr:DUF6600 domain-containing protein [Balneolales bacterium]
MKTKIKYLAFLLLLIVAFSNIPKQVYAQRTYVSIQFFYDQLNAYGRWVDTPDYGYVWYPDVGPEFGPYLTRGHWIFTNFGWTWISEYPWGWITFHYGRWFYDDVYGWFWIPDTVWGPAWVVWVSSGGYYGWAPMGPGITIGISFGVNYYRRHRHWVFVRKRYIDRPNVVQYRIRRYDNDLFIRNSTVINNTYTDERRRARYVTGPKRADVQRFTNRRINEIKVENRNQPGYNIRGDRLQIYRPEVRKKDDRGRRPAPPKVTNRKDLQRPSERPKPRPQPQDKTTQPQDRRKAEPQKKDGKTQQPQRRRDEQTKQKGTKQDRRRTVKPTPTKKDGKSKSQPRRDRSKDKKDKDGKGDI